jgi:hypothetical protein
MAHGPALGNSMEEMLRGLADSQLDPADVDRLGELLLAAQVGSLLDHRIAQLAVTGQDTSAEASAFPAGLPIGVVHYNASNVAEVEPLARLDRLEVVRLFNYGLHGVLPPEAAIMRQPDKKR